MATKIRRRVTAAVRRGAKRARNKVPIETGNYPYVTARVKAKKAFLYTDDAYEKMLRMEVPQIARFIGEGEYKKEILRYGTRFSGVDLVESATSENMANVFAQIIDFSEGRLKVMIRAFLDHWDVRNVKTILRAKLYGVPTLELVDRLVPAGGFSERFLDELAAKESVEEVFAALGGTRYERALAAIGKEPKELTGLAEYEDSLSRLYYSELLEAIPPATFGSKLFRRFVRQDIDLLNLKTLLRLWSRGLRPEREVFLDGGLELSREALAEMLGLNQNALLDALSKCSFYESISEELKSVRERGVSSIFRTLEKQRTERAAQPSYQHPLSVVPALQYIVLKEREVQNLTIIARGKESGLPTDVIHGLLVI